MLKTSLDCSLNIKKAKTVRDAIGYLNSVKEGAVNDHMYPKLRAIDKYRRYYESNKFGWYILQWDNPAPSFGNVMKTYTLHPSSWNGANPRVISIGEALIIFGFNRNFIFPEGIDVGKSLKNCWHNSGFRIGAGGFEPPAT
jgi:DNA (cytosine-5)-methyltransferase 1